MSYKMTDNAVCRVLRLDVTLGNLRNLKINYCNRIFTRNTIIPCIHRGHPGTPLVGLDGYGPLSRIWILLFSVTNRASCWTGSHSKGLMMSYTGQGT